jgi:hypothetical protein
VNIALKLLLFTEHSVAPYGTRPLRLTVAIANAGSDNLHGLLGTAGRRAAANLLTRDEARRIAGQYREAAGAAATSVIRCWAAGARDQT